MDEKEKNAKSVSEMKNFLNVPSVKYGLNTIEKNCEYNYTISHNNSYTENESPINLNNSNGINNEYFDYINKLGSITLKSQEGIDMKIDLEPQKFPSASPLSPTTIKIIIGDGVDGENKSY